MQGKVSPGDPLEIRADTFNTLLDAGAFFARMQNRRGAAPSQPARSSETILVRNDTGGDLPRFGVVGLSEPVIDPVDNEEEFFARVAMKGVVPAAEHRGRFAVLAEPIRAGRLGRAWVSGVCIASVWMNAAGDQFAESKADVVEGLHSGSGSARILWVSGDTGWCSAIIRIGENGPLLGKLDGDLAYNSTATVNVYSDADTDTGSDLTGVKAAPWVTAGTIPSGTFGRVHNDSGTWYFWPGSPSLTGATEDKFLKWDGDWFEWGQPEEQPSALWGKLDGNLVFGSTATASIHSDRSTDTGSDATVYPPLWMPSGLIPAGTFGQVVEFTTGETTKNFFLPGPFWLWCKLDGDLTATTGTATASIWAGSTLADTTQNITVNKPPSMDAGYIAEGQFIRAVLNNNGKWYASLESNTYVGVLLGDLESDDTNGVGLLIYRWSGTEWVNTYYEITVHQPPQLDRGKIPSGTFCKVENIGGVWVVDYHFPTGVYENDILYWDGESWVVFSAPSTSGTFFLSIVNGVMTWTEGTTFVCPE